MGRTWTGGVAENALWECRWRQLAVQLASWYAKPSDTVERQFMAILADEWRGVIGRTWNSERPLVFDHVFLTKTLDVRHTVLQEVYEDLKHHNDGSHVDGLVIDNAIW